MEVLEKRSLELLINTTSPNQAGVEGTDSGEVWIRTDPSAILVRGASLRE